MCVCSLQEVSPYLSMNVKCTTLHHILNEPPIQMQEMLDSLETALTFASPVKDGLGVSTLDRTLLCDNRAELYFKELAAQEAEERVKAARVASGICSLRPIGEVGL